MSDMILTFRIDFRTPRLLLTLWFALYWQTYRKLEASSFPTNCSCGIRMRTKYVTVKAASKIQSSETENCVVICRLAFCCVTSPYSYLYIFLSSLSLCTKFGQLNLQMNF